MRKIVQKTKEDFFNFYVEIFQLLNIPEHLRVSDRTKEFLVNMVILFNEGWNLSSKESVLELADRMNFSNKDEVYNYRKKLKDKGLIVQTKTGLILPPALSLKEIPKEIIFKFGISNSFVNEVE